MRRKSANWVNDQKPPAHVASQAGDQLQFADTPPSGSAVNDFPAGTKFQSIDSTPAVLS
jgi:hypothetical protein